MCVQHGECRKAAPRAAKLYLLMRWKISLIHIRCFCVCYNIENVKDHGEAESQSVQRERKTSLINFGCQNVTTFAEREFAMRVVRCRHFQQTWVFFNYLSV